MSRVRFEIWTTSCHAHRSVVAPDFRAIVRSERVPSLLDGILGARGVVVAALAGDELRGYASLVPSSALVRERWEHLPDAFELGSIEVARSHRGGGIGTGLLGRLHASLPIERLVLFARGFVGHWDTAVAALSLLDYRRMLLRMLGRVGFQRWDTDDPEVSESPMNFLAVRAGLEVPSASLLALAERAFAATRSPWW